MCCNHKHIALNGYAHILLLKTAASNTRKPQWTVLPHSVLVEAGISTEPVQFLISPAGCSKFSLYCNIDNVPLTIHMHTNYYYAIRFFSLQGRQGILNLRSFNFFFLWCCCDRERERDFYIIRLAKMKETFKPISLKHISPVNYVSFVSNSSIWSIILPDFSTTTETILFDTWVWTHCFRKKVFLIQHKSWTHGCLILSYQPNKNFALITTKCNIYIHVLPNITRQET